MTDFLASRKTGICISLEYIINSSKKILDHVSTSLNNRATWQGQGINGRVSKFSDELRLIYLWKLTNFVPHHLPCLNMTGRKMKKINPTNIRQFILRINVSIHITQRANCKIMRYILLLSSVCECRYQSSRDTHF